MNFLSSIPPPPHTATSSSHRQAAYGVPAMVAGAHTCCPSSFTELHDFSGASAAEGRCLMSDRPVTEGRTDPQRRWAGFDCKITPSRLAVVRCDSGCGCPAVEVVPADDQLTAEESAYLIEYADWPWAQEEGLEQSILAKLRRIAGREDS